MIAAGFGMREAHDRDPHHRGREHTGECGEGELRADPTADEHRHREERGQQRIVRAHEVPVGPDLLLQREVVPVEHAGALVGPLVAEVQVVVLAQADRGHQVLRLVGGHVPAGGRVGRETGRDPDRDTEGDDAEEPPAHGVSPSARHGGAW